MKTDEGELFLYLPWHGMVIHLYFPLKMVPYSLNSIYQMGPYLFLSKGKSISIKSQTQIFSCIIEECTAIKDQVRIILLWAKGHSSQIFTVIPPIYLYIVSAMPDFSVIRKTE